MSYMTYLFYTVQNTILEVQKDTYTYRTEVSSFTGSDQSNHILALKATIFYKTISHIILVRNHS